MNPDQKGVGSKPSSSSSSSNKQKTTSPKSKSKSRSSPSTPHKQRLLEDTDSSDDSDVAVVHPHPSISKSTGKPKSINIDSSIEQELNRLDQQKKFQPSLAKSTNAINFGEQQPLRLEKNTISQPRVLAKSTDAIHYGKSQQQQFSSDDVSVDSALDRPQSQQQKQQQQSQQRSGLLSVSKDSKLQQAKSTDAIIYYNPVKIQPPPPPLPRQTSRDSTTSLTTSSSSHRSFEQELNQPISTTSHRFQSNFGRQTSIELTNQSKKSAQPQVLAKSIGAINYYDRKMGESSVDQPQNKSNKSTNDDETIAKSTGALNYVNEQKKLAEQQVLVQQPATKPLAKSTDAINFHYIKHGQESTAQTRETVVPDPVPLAKSTDAINYNKNNQIQPIAYTKSTGDINNNRVGRRESDEMVYHEIDHPLQRREQVAVDIVHDRPAHHQHMFVQQTGPSTTGGRYGKHRLNRQHNVRRSDMGRRYSRPKVYSSNTTIGAAWGAGDGDSTISTPIRPFPSSIPTTGTVHASQSQSNLYNRRRGYAEMEEFSTLSKTKSFSFLRSSAHNLSKLFHFDKNTFLQDYKESHQLDPEYDLDSDEDIPYIDESSDDNLLRPAENVKMDQLRSVDGPTIGQQQFEGAGAGIGVTDSTSYKFPQPKSVGYDTDDPELSNRVIQMVPPLKSQRRRSTIHGRIRKRVILKHGNINLCAEHLNRRNKRYLRDMFTTMVDIRWRWNLMVFAMGFLVSWTSFAIIWWLIAFSHSDFDHINDESWNPCVVNINSFLSTLLFSIETQHTIGYGSRFTTEECPEAILVMCLQSITGVMIQCFMVGFVFSKLSRPQKRSQTLMFSRNAVICVRDSRLCLMFRVGDLRNRSHIIGGKISAQVLRKKISPEGEVIPYFHSNLTVRFDEMGDDVFLIWPAIIVHEINEDSPFYHMDIDAMMRDKFEIVAILEGTVESTGQLIQARTSYLPSEILWGYRFEQLVKFRKQTGEYMVDYAKFNSTYETNTPTCSAAEYARVLYESNFDEDYFEDEDPSSMMGQDRRTLRQRTCRTQQEHVYDILPQPQPQQYQFVNRGPPQGPAPILQGTTSKQAPQNSSTPNSPSTSEHRKVERVKFDSTVSGGTNSTPMTPPSPPPPPSPTLELLQKMK